MEPCKAFMISTEFISQNQMRDIETKNGSLSVEEQWYIHCDPALFYAENQGSSFNMYAFVTRNIGVREDKIKIITLD